MSSRKTYSRGLFVSISLVSICLLSMIIPQSSFSLTLYDDFSGTLIDKTRWGQNDFVREIQDEQLRMKVRTTSSDTGPLVTNHVSFPEPQSINTIEAKVKPLAYYNPDNTSVRAGISGEYYNDGTYNNWEGEVSASISIGGNSERLVALWGIVRHTNPTDPNPVESLYSGEFATPIDIGTFYTLSLSWEGGSFTLKVNNEEVKYTPSTPVEGVIHTARRIQNRVLYPEGKNAYMEVLFDDVKVNGELYDDFSGDTINLENWTTPEGTYDLVRNVEDGGLRMKIRTSEIDTNAMTTNSLGFTDSVATNIIQVDITPLAYVNPSGITIHTIIAGEYYNDGTNNGWEGEVSAYVGIGGTGADPVGSWSVKRHTNASDPNQVETLASGDFATPIDLFTPYTFLLFWNGTHFIFRLNDEEATYTPTTAVHPVLHPAKRLQARALSPDGKESMIDATFDNVMVIAQGEYRLKVVSSSSKNGSGSIRSNDGIISCGDGGACIYGYAKNTKITLEASPNAGSVFAGWTPTSLKCGNSITCEVTVDKSKTVTAKFRGPNKLKVKVRSKNGGAGSVSSHLAGIGGSIIDCPSSLCEGYFTLTDTVPLTATPQGTATFGGWKPSSLDCGAELTCNVPMNRTRNVQATFIGP